MKPKTEALSVLYSFAFATARFLAIDKGGNDSTMYRHNEERDPVQGMGSPWERPTALCRPPESGRRSGGRSAWWRRSRRGPREERA